MTLVCLVALDGADNDIRGDAAFVERVIRSDSSQLTLGDGNANKFTAREKTRHGVT